MSQKYGAKGCPEERVAAATVRKRILLNLRSLQTDYAISARCWQAGQRSGMRVSSKTTACSHDVAMQSNPHPMP